MDAFALSNSVGQLFDLGHKVLTFPVAKVGSVGNVADLPAQAIANPQGTIAGSGYFLQGTGCQERPGKVATIDPAFSGGSVGADFGTGGTPASFVALVAGLDHFHAGFFQQESVVGIDAVSFAETATANVVSQQVGVGSNEVAQAFLAGSSHLASVELGESR